MAINPCDATEESLTREAGSLGELLEQLRERAFPRLIDAPAWDRITARARELPVTLAAFPFGFEAPLHEPELRADLGVTVAGGSRTAAFFRDRASGKDTDTTAAGIARLLDRMGQEATSLQRVVGSRLMLEYDIDGKPQGRQSPPGIFLFPVDEALAGGRGSAGLADLGLALDALHTATGWDPDCGAARLAQRVYRALAPAMRVQSVGAFPARGRDIRLALANIRKMQELTAFLERAGWTGRDPLVDATVSQLKQRSAFDYLAAHLDLGEKGIGPRLGLSCYVRKPQWLQAQSPPGRDMKPLANLIDGLRVMGCGVAEKLSALADTPPGTETLLMKSGAYTFVRGISHLKLTLVRGRVEQVKAYVFLLLVATGRPPA